MGVPLLYYPPEGGRGRRRRRGRRRKRRRRGPALALIHAHVLLFALCDSVEQAACGPLTAPPFRTLGAN